MKSIQFANSFDTTIVRCKSVRVLFALLVLGGLFSSATVRAAEPIYAQQAKLTAGTGGYFGCSAAVSGNWAVIGAVGGNAAYVYSRIGSNWILYQTLTAGEPSDSFGHAVAINGTNIVIGAPNNGDFDQGAAYVFTLAGTLWTQKQKLMKSNGTWGDHFGASVAINGATIVVGALRESNTGAVYIFDSSSSGWIQSQMLTETGGSGENNFGRQVAISGETVAVSAYAFDGLLPVGPGLIYLYVRAGGIWSLQQKLTAKPTDEYRVMQLGGLSGNTLVVGRYGFARIYVRTGTTWLEQQELQLPDVQYEPLYFFYLTVGGSIAFDGDRIVIGASNNRVLGNDSRGTAYIFARNGTTWSFAQKLIAIDGAAEDLFGSATAISGETILVGAPHDDIGVNAETGSAYIFSPISGNILPTITPANTINIQQGATLTNVFIATVNDLEDPAGSLLADPQIWPGAPNPTVSNVVNNGGNVTATISASCSGMTGERKIGLNVIDSQFGVGTGVINFNVIPNPTPTLGEYASAFVLPGQSVTVAPSTAPSGNGSITTKAYITPDGFPGTVTVNQITGAVTISNALPAGFSGTVHVYAKESCSPLVWRQFSLTVAKYYAPPILTASANPAPAGQSVMFTATVPTPRGAPAPTGTIQFQINGTNWGPTTPLRNGSASATNSALPAGEHRITAIYSGDASYQNAASTITQRVNR
jgi:hypothetical protein